MPQRGHDARKGEIVPGTRPVASRTSRFSPAATLGERMAPEDHLHWLIRERRDAERASMPTSAPASTASRKAPFRRLPCSRKPAGMSKPFLG
jgi:hypothetical protein